MTDFKRLSIQDAKQMLEQQDVTLVDIRDDTSFSQSRLKGAQHLSNMNLQAFIESVDLDKPLIVYCYHGHSSLSAAQFLCEKGFDEVYSLDGGFEAWRTLFEIESY